MKNLILGLAALLWAAQNQAATEQDRASSAILLQGFHWHAANGSWYRNLESKAADFQNLGMTHVWFPPPSNSGAREGYLPRELFNLNSAYGSEDELRAAISALQRHGISAVADVVINHRVGNWNWGDFSNPSWGCETVTADDEWPGRCGGKESGTSYGAARDIDHAQPVVQNDLKYFLGERLRSVGFTGWRYDYAKGYSPAYTKLYNEASHPEFCVGEIWTTLLYDKVDQHRQELMQYIEGTSGTCGAFDFTSKGLLNKVLRDHDFGRLRDSLGRPAGGIGVWPQKMVTFVDNHDTGPSGACGTGQNLWPIPCDQVMPAYAYILSHPGIPSVYYPHLYDWNLRDSIRSLIQVRKSTGIQSNSAVSIQHAENGLYAAIIQGRDGRLAVRIGSRDWNPGSSWDLVTWGQHYSVWMQR